MRDRQQHSTSFYYGHDADTGQSIVTSGGGFTRTRSLSTNQPTVGQLGKGLFGGYDSGNVRRTKIEIFPKTDKYPFKTLSLLIGSGTFAFYLGGDRNPQQIANFFGANGLANTGGESQWSASIRGPELHFYSAVSNPPNLTYQSPANNLIHKGGNFWSENTPSFPQITIQESIVSGQPPTPSTIDDSFDLENGSSGIEAYNFAANYTHQASLPGALWPPYSVGPQNIGTQTRVVTTTYDGVIQNNPNRTLSPQSIQHTESRAGNLKYPVRLFQLYPNAPSNLGILGEGQRLKEVATNGSSDRATDFSTFNSISTKSDKTITKTSIPATILGQSFQWLQENFSEINSTTTDTRQVTGGTTATWQFNETRITRTDSRNPFTDLLIGNGVAYVPVSQVGTTTTQTTNEIKAITSSSWSRSIRPSMKGPVLYSTPNYILALGGQRQGSLGGWYAFSNADTTARGEEIPTANLHRLGNPFPSGFPGSQASQYSGNLLYAAEYDASGAYGDNFTTGNTYSEYDITEAKSIRGNIYDQALTLVSPFNLVMNRTLTINYTYDYLLSSDKKIVTNEGVFSILDDQIFTSTPSSEYVSVPQGVGTITLSAPLTSTALGLRILTSRQTQRRETHTLTQTYTNGVRTQNVFRVDITYVGNSLPSLVGKKAEVYRYLNNKLTKWTGVIVSYSGVNSPEVPPSSRTRPDGTLESNTIEGVFSQTITVNNLVINAESVEASDYAYTGSVFYSVVLNLDYYFTSKVSPEWSNLVAGSNDSLAKLYIANSSTYKAGSVNTVDVWEFIKVGTNAIPKYIGTEKGKTKKGVMGETLQAILYAPAKNFQA